MVATLPPIDRFRPLSADLIPDGRWPRPYRFTWEDVLLLMRHGLVPEDSTVELLDGVIVAVDRGTNGKESEVAGRTHVLVTERFSDLRTSINSPTRHVETQQPLRCSETYVPNPDFMVIRGALEDYPADAPEGRDAWCVVEVADSSLRRDTVTKLAAYAAAGVPQYVVIDLAARRAIVHETPDVAAGTYPPPTIIAGDGSLSLRIGDAERLSIALVDFLP